MSYEDQLIRESTGDKLLHDGYESDLGLEEATPEATGKGIEMAQQGETL